MNGKQAWATLAVGVLVYEVLAADGQLLSEIVDEWLISHPILTRAVIGAFALHLANITHPKYDPVSASFRLLRKIFEGSRDS